MLETGFNEHQQTALGLLFENYWILRQDEPSNYQLIRENEKALRRYVSEKLGYSLIIHKDFIKLEKVPVNPKSWMGIQDFQQPRDYVLFCCGLAYLENRSVEDQFLLSELAKDLEESYPGLIKIDWTNYQHRQSLVRVLKKMVELNCIREVDSYSGGIEEFARFEEQEVLYQGTIYSRYYMRNHLHSLKSCQTTEDILKMDWERSQDDTRRKRVYRKLLVEPVMYRTELDDEDFDYIRRYRNRVREDIEEHTPFELEVTKNAAMVTLPEPKQLYESYPDRKALSLVSLHVQSFLRHNLEKFEVSAFGDIRLTDAQFKQVIEDVSSEYKSGWSIEYREKSGLKKIAGDVLTHLIEWSFARIEEETGLIVLMPAIARMKGQYPDDFEEEAD
ncbi:TIGR02678 family protein [Alkalibacterium psychrotolerans]